MDTPFGASGSFGHSGFRSTDHAAVQVGEVDPTASFATLFRTHYAPRLDKRAEGFAALFAAVERDIGSLLILETGTLRMPGNWAGDGQSTYMFDVLVQASARQGRPAGLFSIDLQPASIAAARGVCSSAANLICNDSVYALTSLARQMPGRRVALLYLDSFDYDGNDPMASAAHHMMELVAVSPMLGAGSLVAIDDYRVDVSPGGKGLLVDRYMDSVGAEVVYSGYQKVWRLR